MKKFINLMLATVYLASSLFASAALLPIRVAAETKETKTVTTDQNSNTKKEVTYNYIAQSGDSYSKISRKAIQTYAIKNKINLSNAKVIAAETWMTQAAGSPLLNQGEKTQVKESAVKSFVDLAKKLDAATEARWNVFTKHVNFNTNAVGQTARK